MRALALRLRPRLRIAPQLVLLLLVLGLASAMAVEPTRQLLAQRDRIADMEAELGVIERQNRRLELRIRQLQNPDFLEQQAREQIGLVMPGETAYVVTPPTKRAERKEAPSRRRATPQPRTSGADGEGFLEGLLHFIGIG